MIEEDSQTGEEKLAALLAVLIMRFLAVLFGVRVKIPPLTAQAARQRIEEKTRELAQARQEAVRAHFETDGVQAVLKQRRLLRSCLVSQNLAVRQAMQA